MRIRHIIITAASMAAFVIGCSKKPSQTPAQQHEQLQQMQERDQREFDTVLPGRHMSEHQVFDIASRELPQGSSISCKFKDGVWEVSWGVASYTTNADGHLIAKAPNAMRLGLKVRDADGKVERVKAP